MSLDRRGFDEGVRRGSDRTRGKGGWDVESGMIVMC